MNDEFNQIVGQMPLLLEKLISSPLRPWEDLGNLPKRGIYVFYENGQAIYVGRTNRITISILTEEDFRYVETSALARCFSRALGLRDEVYAPKEKVK